MYFEITLRSEETYETHFSYGLVFIPCPVWFKGSEKIINLNPNSPRYHKGSVKKLVEKKS